MISKIDGKVGLCVRENGIAFFRTVLVLFNRVDLSIQHIYFFDLVLNDIFFVLLYSTNCLTKSFDPSHLKNCCIHQKLGKHVLFWILDGKEYSFLVREEDLIYRFLHGDNFGGQLAIFKVLLTKNWYWLYKLKCLINFYCLIFTFLCLHVFLSLCVCAYFY